MRTLNRYVLLISLTAALGGLLFGFDTAVISGAIPHLTAAFHLDGYRLGWAVSAVLAGCALGAAAAGKAADRFGRRATLMVCALLFALSGAGAGLAGSLPVFSLFRLIGGLGVGAAAMVSPMYIAETAPAAFRGRLVSLYQLAIMAGILLAYLADYALSGNGDDWRLMFGSQVMPALLFFISLLAVPETPRWLLQKNRTLKAQTVLTRIHGKVGAAVELAQIGASLADTSTVTINWRRYRKVLLAGILIAVFQQVTGINAILYYAPAIFRATGIDTASSLLQTIGIGTVNLLATLIAISLVDRWGRKRFLLAGCLLMAFSLAGVALCFHYHFFAGYIVLLFLLVYVSSFSCTLGAVTWVYLSEIFPNRFRAMGLSVATLALWLADFAVSFTFPLLNSGLGIPATLLVYVCFCLSAFWFIRRVPETKGKTLEEIEILFTDEK